jgi:predicted PurR-regulated permease PerM
MLSRTGRAPAQPGEDLLTTPAATPDSGPLVPDWLAQAASLGWRLLVVVALGLVILETAAILGTVIASVVLAAAITAAFDPLAARLRAGGRSKTAAAGLVTLTAAGLAVLVIAIVAIAFVPGTVEMLRALKAGLDELQKAVESGSIRPPLSTLVTDLVNGVTGWVTAALTSLVATLANGATILLLAIFLLFFMVIDADRAIDWTLQAAAPWQQKMIRDGVGIARLRVGRSLRETALRSTLLGAVALVAAFVLGLPAPLALGVLVFVGGFVPLLGPIATIAFVGMVALGSAGAPAAIVIVALLALTPVVLPHLPGLNRWHGHGVHPAVVLVALTIGALVSGLLGLVLAVPVVMLVGEIAPDLIAALNGDPDPAPTTSIVPRWLDRLAQWSWRLLALAAVAALALAGVTLVPLILVPFIIAAVAAATLAPGMRILRRRRLAPTTASLALTVGGFGVILAILAITLATLARQGAEIASNASTGADKIDNLLQSGRSVASIAAAVGPQVVQALAVIIAGLAGLAISVILGGILTFFFLRDSPAGFEALTRPLARWRHDELEAAATRATGVLGGYMIGTGAISAVGAASQFLIMALLGIPLAWPLAVLSFFGGFIPYIGSLLTTGLAFLVTVALGSTQDIVVMAIFTLVFNIVQGNIVAPLVYGKAVSIHPAVVLLAIPAGAALGGIAGMFLAVPVIGVVATTWRTLLRVFGSEPADRAATAAADMAPGAAAEPALPPTTPDASAPASA